MLTNSYSYARLLVAYFDRLCKRSKWSHCPAVCRLKQIYADNNINEPDCPLDAEDYEIEEKADAVIAVDNVDNEPAAASSTDTAAAAWGSLDGAWGPDAAEASRRIDEWVGSCAATEDHVHLETRNKSNNTQRRSIEIYENQRKSSEITESSQKSKKLK